LPKQAHFLWRYVILVFTLFLFSGTAIGQTFPSPDTKCVSEDMEVVSATLGQSCVPCTPGTNLLENLVLQVKNKTKSTRRAFAYWATVEITSPTGAISTMDISGCQAGPWAGGETRKVPGQQIPFVCGSTIRLTNVFLAWTDASDQNRNTCSDILANPNSISPKCDRPTEIRVSTPPSAPVLTVVQPTCTVAKGSITITNTTGLVFSLNNDDFAAYPSGGYTNLSPGVYSIRSRNADGCISPPSTATINPQPATPAAPTLTAVQPTCAVATGSIMVTAPVGEELQYSINGGAYQSGTTFNNLAAGTYNVTVRNSAGCISPATQKIINAQPVTPPKPVVTPMHPTCTVATGSITVTAPTGAGIQYSINGGTTWQTATLFSGLAPGTYNVIARNADGCVSYACTVIINPRPVTPPKPVVTPMHPTCTVATGSITVTAPTGAGIQYSINGGTTWQTATLFSGLAPGTYNVIARNADGCVSYACTVIINPRPATPAKPTVTVVQPTCTVATGSITITSATTGLTFSLDGGAYAAYPAGGYTGLAAGLHTITAKAGNCISGQASITLNAATNCVAFEGCTLGYWKNHTDRWCKPTYTPNTLYGNVFKSSYVPIQFKTMTLLQVLNLGGGGIYNLARQSVAALLNICHSEVDYNSAYPTTTDLIKAVNAAYKTGGNAPGTLATKLDGFNNAGCPLGGSSATTKAYSKAPDASDLQVAGSEDDLSVTPNPFQDQATITFSLKEAGDYTLELHDVNGRVVKHISKGKAEANKVYSFEIGSGSMSNGIYMIRLSAGKSSKAIRVSLNR